MMWRKEVVERVNDIKVRIFFFDWMNKFYIEIFDSKNKVSQVVPLNKKVPSEKVLIKKFKKDKWYSLKDTFSFLSSRLKDYLPEDIKENIVDINSYMWYKRNKVKSY